MNTRKTLIVVGGPTGSGKTDLSISLAEHFTAPIISADSRQFFKNMAIGTAQPSKEQLEKVEHHLIASLDISENYNCGRYEQDALVILGELFKKHDIVIAVGGSGLYINALCYGLDNLPSASQETRSELERRLQKYGLNSLLAQLEELDPIFYDKVDKSNPVRIMRALEVCISTGKPYSSLRSGEKATRDFNIIKIATEMPRDLLYDRINLRVDLMIENGLEAEARKLFPYRSLNSLQTVGYREMFDYFDGKISKEEAVELIKRNSRRYAKRQITWFKKDESTAWFNPNNIEEIIEYLEGKLK